MKTALITGAFGQDGYFLTKKLIEDGTYQIICTNHSFKKKISDVYRHQNVRIEHLDICNEYEVINFFKKNEIDEVYHLASFSAPILSWDNPKEVIAINGYSTLYFLDAIRLFSNNTKFFFASSAKIFGKPTKSPQTENTLINPLDPYSLGKYISHQAIKLYREKYNIFACNGILYNHESHLKNENFVAYKICKNAKLIKKGKIKNFSLFNLDSTIDLGDPRDYVDAMHLILQQPNPDDYIIALNISFSIKELCKKIADEFEIPNILSHIKITQSTTPPLQITLQGDNSKLKSIGWIPKYSIRDTLRLIIDNLN